MQNFYTYKVVINKEQNNKRVDQAIANLLDKITRSQIKLLIKNKNIEKEGVIINDASKKVIIGENYKINIPKIKETIYSPEDISIDIIYEDQHIIVLNKQAGIVTHPATGNFSGTLVNALLMHTSNSLSNINGNNRPGIVHRLDKETSGLMVIAKNNESHVNLAEQFKIHSIERKYSALVWGSPENQDIEGYIERHRINRKKMSVNKNNRGKYSKTSIKIKKNFDICSLIECNIYTGRTHQVRVHLNSINFPIVGDKLYGKNKVNKFSKEKNQFNKFLILKNFNRQALHASYLGFVHPMNKKYLKFESEFPQDIKNLLDFLLKY